MSAAPSGLPCWPQLEALPISGRYRSTPEEFRVDELSGWTPAGSGEHLLLRVAKRGANTAWVAAALARRAGCRVSEVGYCGEKDRHATTTQWFSIRDPAHRLDWRVGEGSDDWSILALDRHDRKLRRGDHAGNRFELRIELDPQPGEDVIAAARARLAAGMPNYFGPQRFGRDGANLARAGDWVAGKRLPERGPQRGRILSTARALLFNAVLAERVRAGTFAQVIEGDVVDNGMPTGPLWGRGRSPAGAAAAAVEARALEPYQAWCERLEHAGLRQQRRSLMIRPEAARLEVGAGALTLAFDLPAGAFATAVLAALGSFTDAAVDAAGQ